MPQSADVEWTPSVWEDINRAVVAEVAKVRVTQKVFPTTVFDTSPTEVPNDPINFVDSSIREGQTKPFVEIYQEFILTSAQVAKEPQLKTAEKLARMAAKAIALAEDTVQLRGDVDLPGGVKADVREGKGLLGEAEPQNDDGTPDTSDTDPSKVSVPIEVDFRDDRPPSWGENLFSAVVEGITKLTGNKGQTGQFALLLPVDAYADSHSTVNTASLVTTAERIRPMLDGGLYVTATLPGAVFGDLAPPTPGLGLLVALGGHPTTLYVGREAEVEFVRKLGSSYIFRVVERVQFVARDRRAFVLLKFRPPPTLITHIRVDPASVTLTKAAGNNHTEQLFVTDSNDKDRTEDAGFTSSDTEKVAVTPSGLITGENITATPQNEVQKVTITGSPAGGAFTLTFKGRTTEDIKRDADAEAVKSALEKLSTIGQGNATVTLDITGNPVYTVTFTNKLGEQNLPPMTAKGGFTGGTDPKVAVTTFTPGVAPVRVRATVQGRSASCDVKVVT